MNENSEIFNKQLTRFMSSTQQFTRLEGGLLVRAPAKLNLSLLICGMRPDGFHNIRSLMAKLDYYDELFIEKSAENGLNLICDGPCWAPEGADNIVSRAYELLFEKRSGQPGLKIRLLKNIPAGSGLGSASSDAAAALMGINSFLNLGLTKASLSTLAGKLGSDVPFFLGGPLSFCSGRGEKIKKISKKYDFSALLILPNVNVSTAKVYSNYQHDKRLFRRLNSQITEALRKNRIDLLNGMCTNMLQESCFRLHKVLFELKGKTEAMGLKPLCMSGSGSCMYHIFDEPDSRRAILFQHQINSQTGCKSVIVKNNDW